MSWWWFAFRAPDGAGLPFDDLAVGQAIRQVLAPTGPVGQRYGSDQPWPWDRFG